MGEVWANVLNEMYWNIVDRFGYTANWYDAKQNAGNIFAMQLVVSGLKIQPCNPTFITARDSIIQADQNLYDGLLKCDIWAAFAKRGLGVKASGDNGFVADNSVPPECLNRPTSPPAPKTSSVVAAPSSVPEPSAVAPKPSASSSSAAPKPSVFVTVAPPIPSSVATQTPTTSLPTIPSGIPSSTIPAPTNVPIPETRTKIVFGADSAFVSGPITRSEPVALSYDLRRIGSYCRYFAVCASTVFTKEVCVSQAVGPRGALKNVSIKFPKAGTSYLRFVTYEIATGCFKQDSSGIFGYRVLISK